MKPGWLLTGRPTLCRRKTTELCRQVVIASKKQSIVCCTASRRMCGTSTLPLMGSLIPTVSPCVKVKRSEVGTCARIVDSSCWRYGFYFARFLVCVTGECIFKCPHYLIFFRFASYTTSCVCNNTGAVDNSCETRKQDDHTLIALDSSGSAVNASAVIVLNPVGEDSVCNLQCAVGWYHEEYGNAAPFLCAAQTSNRTLREGIPTYPINCKREIRWVLLF